MKLEDRALAAATTRLAAAGCVAAADEATMLLGAASGPAQLERWLQRREQGEPPAWITGRWWFCGRPLHVQPGVYVPRHQSEELARRAATLLPAGGRALDLCTGAGAIAAHLGAEVPTATVIGVDLDVAAAANARRNGVTAVVGDLADALRARRSFDVVTAVAPYVPTAELRLLPADVQRYEPPHALDGGEDGLGLVQRVIEAAGRRLVRGGWLLLELGGDQDRRAQAALTDHGFGPLECWHDEDGDLRGVLCRLTG